MELEKLEKVNNITDVIAKCLGYLSSEEIVPTDESIYFVKKLVDYQNSWMEKNFTEEQKFEFEQKVFNGK